MGTSKDPTIETDLDRDLRKAMERLAVLRRLRASAPTEPDAGLSDDELNRQLLIDMLQIMTRSEVALRFATDALIDHTDAIRTSTSARIAEHEATTLERTNRTNVIGQVAKLGGQALESKTVLVLVSSLSTLALSALAHWGWVLVGL
jgi:hypothetical protein